MLLTSCGEEIIEYDEDEVISAAGTLIRKSAEFNIIFWGDGIPYESDTNYDNGIYSPSVPNYKYTLIDNIIKDAENIFSSGYMTNVKRTVFSAQFGDTGVDGYARYYQDTELDPIMVRTDYKPVLVDKNEYLYDTIVIDGADEKAVYVKISIKVTRDDAYQIITSRIKLVNEEGWRIDSHTFANYNANI
jgi:hypothetical protein